MKALEEKKPPKTHSPDPANIAHTHTHTALVTAAGQEAEKCL